MKKLNKCWRNNMKDKSLILDREKTVKILGWQKTRHYPTWTNRAKNRQERDYLTKLLNKYRRNGGE